MHGCGGRIVKLLNLFRPRAQLPDDKINQLWELVGATKARLDNSDRQFNQLESLMQEVREEMKNVNSNVTAYNARLDKHLTIHRYFNRVIASISAFLITWWKAS